MSVPGPFRPSDYRLYFVTDPRLNAGRPLLRVLEEALEGGIRLVQYRDKESDEETFRAEAREALDLCRRFGAVCLFNDRVEAAKDLGADGVHLGQDDMPIEDARRILGPAAVIGLSTHNEAEIEASRNLPVTYVNIGPIFPTATKDHSAYPALGPDRVLALSQRCVHPFTTMGGIKQHHLPELFSRGVSCTAMVTEISLAPRVTEKVRELFRALPA